MKARVLHVIDSFDLGGGQTVLLNLVKYADRERFDVSVATMHGRGAFWQPIAETGVPVYSLSPRKWLPIYVPQLLQLLARKRFDIVHCHLFGSNWIAKPLAALARVPVLINHDHCNDSLRDDQPLALALDKWTNQLSSHVCAVSASTRDYLVQREGLPADCVSLIYNGVDVARFRDLPSRRDPEAPVVLGIGRLHPQKNFELFLEVAADVLRQHPRATFLIAGTGPEEEMLKRRAAELALGERVRFLGPVSDPRELYARADLLLLTSRYEGTPMVILEAMAAGVPIVAAALDGVREVLKDGEDAALVTPGDRAEFARRVSELLAAPASAQQLAHAARVKVEKSYSAEVMTRNVEEIYKRCLRQAGTVRKQVP